MKKKLHSLLFKIIVLLMLLAPITTTSQILIPESFSPNNDGLNDCLKIKSTDSLDIYKITIFNSWGETVWQTDNIDEVWFGNDDYYSPSRIFSYTIKYRVKGYSFIKTKKGYITIL